MSDSSIKANITADKLDAAFILNLQLNRVNECAAWDNKDAFERNVDILLKQLPVDIKTKVQARSALWFYTTETYKFENYGGRDQGSIEDPLYVNGVLFSPKLVTEQIKDYSVMYEIILEELEYGGYTYRNQKNSEDAGNVSKKKTKAKKTPVRNADDEDEELE